MAELVTGARRFWTDVYDAAETIKHRFGLHKALEYLIGGKLLTFVSYAESDDEYASELPRFITAIHRLFTGPEIKDYLDRLQRQSYRIRRHPLTEADRMDFSLERISKIEETLKFDRMRELLGFPRGG